MTLQYDKKEILDKEINIEGFPTEEILPEKCGKCDNCKNGKVCVENIKDRKRKETYRIVLTYGHLLSNISDESNALKKRYFNVLKTIVKTVNNLVMKFLVENSEEKQHRKYYSAEIITEDIKQKEDKNGVKPEKPLQRKVLKKIVVNGSGKSFI